jgi:excisionase family DNA binding protein
MSAREKNPAGVGGERDRRGASLPLGADLDVLKVMEAAALLRVNEKTLREAIARREVPGVRRIGRVIRLSRGALLDWLSGKPAA